MEQILKTHRCRPRRRKICVYIEKLDPKILNILSPLTVNKGKSLSSLSPYTLYKDSIAELELISFLVFFLSPLMFDDML